MTLSPNQTRLKNFVLDRAKNTLAIISTFKEIAVNIQTLIMHIISSFGILILYIIYLQNNIPENKIDTFGGKVCTFGSFRLGVHTKGNTFFC